jgi:hypothetical protein
MDEKHKVDKQTFLEIMAKGKRALSGGASTGSTARRPSG